MIAEVAAGGDRLATLEALRDRLAVEIDDCDSKRDVAALSQRLVEVLAQIDSLVGGSDKSAEDSTFDELNRRRASRRSGAPRRARAQNRQSG